MENLDVKKLDYHGHNTGMGGWQAIIELENGYLISVVTEYFFPGFKQELPPFRINSTTPYEITVCNENGAPIDTYGYLTDKRANELLKELFKFEKNFDRVIVI